MVIYEFGSFMPLSFLSMAGSRVVLKSPIIIKFSVSLVSGRDLNRVSKIFDDTVSLCEGAYRQRQSIFSSFSLSFM